MFWKEKSVEDVVTLGPMAQAALLGVNVPSEQLYGININELYILFSI